MLPIKSLINYAGVVIGVMIFTGEPNPAHWSPAAQMMHLGLAAAAGFVAGVKG